MFDFFKFIYNFKYFLDDIWMSPIREEQKEYNKSRCLLPQDDDWRRFYD